MEGGCGTAAEIIWAATIAASRRSLSLALARGSWRLDVRLHLEESQQKKSSTFMLDTPMMAMSSQSRMEQHGTTGGGGLGIGYHVMFVPLAPNIWLVGGGDANE